MVSTKADPALLRAIETMPDKKSDQKDSIHAESGTQDIDALLDADTRNLTPDEAQQLIQALRKAAKDEHSKSNPRTSSGQYTPNGRPVASRFKSLREFDQALSEYNKNKAKEEETEEGGIRAEAVRRLKLRQ